LVIKRKKKKVIFWKELGATILVIDDSVDDQRLYQRALKDSGYSLEMAFHRKRKVWRA